MDSKNWHHLLQRLPNTNKYDYGHVLVIGGSEAMVGAPVLVARAALRTGAGLVTIASTATTTRLIDRDIEEVMTFSLPPWHEVKALVSAIEKFIQERHVSVVVIGPGLPSAADELIRVLLSVVMLPMVVDAEAFTALSGHLSILKAATKANKNIILTPHSGEYARLTKGIVILTGLTERESIQKFTQHYPVTLVLKHAHTLVVRSQEEVHENTTGHPGLATAGGAMCLRVLWQVLLHKV